MCTAYDRIHESLLMNLTCILKNSLKQIAKLHHIHGANIRLALQHLLSCSSETWPQTRMVLLPS